MKVSIVGAGSVGSSCAEYLAIKDIADEIVLLDIKEGFAEGKSLDLMQTSSSLGFNAQISGVTSDYKKTASSDVVVITSGIPRKPGMTREELIGINAGIVDSVSENLLKHSPNAIIIVVSNPMDTMTYLVLKKTGLPRNRVIGMGGVLDSSRFKTYISLSLNNESQKNINAMVIGGHGDTTMIPLTDHASVNDKPLSELLSVDEISKIASDTMVGGATLTKLLGTSAWYAPGASVAHLVKSILNDSKEILPCSVMLKGEYDFNDLCIGVPCTIGAKGAEEIIEINLNDINKERFQKSVEAVKNTNLALKGLI
jgi:malate dehydrogenase